ncbi:MAG TPA: DUF1501 domain-containing protein [Pirellulaceae bacterium]|jgi:uncharacterized protein (DUF1501 family)|nr:DUF1501 domain-containing protein [Pirellulaceae bacterium]
MSDIKIATRREFLTHGLGMVGIGAALPNFLLRSSLAGPKAQSDERIVVALALIGGHDGLSDVPPYGHKEYYEYRKLTRIEERDVIKLNDEVGLHPNLGGFKELQDEGKFATVLGTAYPNFNLSHFVGRDIWESANRSGRTGKDGSTGWLGRYLDHAFKGNNDPKLSLAVGPGRHPLTVTGADHPGIAFKSPDSFAFVGDQSEKGYALYRELNELSKDNRCTPDDQFVTQTAINANASSETIRELVSGYKSKVTYPDTQFGNSLRTIAGLINRGMSTRVYYAAQGIAVFGGYDTHVDQPRRHGQLMDELCQSVSAFQQDLAQQGNEERVLTFTFSEFGRRAKENYSGGTDHGLAQPMFLFGPGVKAGVHGTQPSLTDLDQDNLKMTTDFRSVYTAILEKWLGVPAEPILGAKYPLLDCVV